MKRLIVAIVLSGILIALVLPASASAWTKGPPTVTGYGYGVAEDGRPYLYVTWDDTGGKPTYLEWDEGAYDQDVKVDAKEGQARIKYLYFAAGFHGEVSWTLGARWGSSARYYHTF